MTVDISTFPQYLADALNISTFGGQLIASVFVVALITVCIAIFTRDPITLIIFVFLGLTVDIALGWLDYWVLFVVALMIALAYSKKITDMLGGLGGS